MTVVTDANDVAVYHEVVAGADRAAVAVADLNHDALPDLLTAGGSGPSLSDGVSVLLNMGGASFPTFSPHTHFAVGYGPVDVAAADFDGDGSLDVVTANSDLTASRCC